MCSITQRQHHTRLQSTYVCVVCETYVCVVCESIKQHAVLCKNSSISVLCTSKVVAFKRRVLQCSILCILKYVAQSTCMLLAGVDSEQVLQYL